MQAPLAAVAIGVMAGACGGSKTAPTPPPPAVVTLTAPQLDSPWPVRSSTR
ncbi:MAG TPA: hypothetical protein VL225_13315 [Vicinamibacterales bacterium]|nr:hypothetical protein [Vicinamibacterales bacterium]